MKISQMTADQAADVLIRISQPIANIIDDPETEPMIKQLSESRGLPPMKLISMFLPKVTMIALKSHRQDVYEIVGALAQEPASKMGKKPVLELVGIIKESVDQDLIDFFRSSGNPTEIAGEESE